MGGEGSGGTRSGTPGRAYSNRTDLNARRTLPAATPKNQPYGAAKRSLDSQRAVPLANPPSPAPTSSTPPPPAAGRALATPFNAPTARPDEPITSGLPIGPGPGPETLFQPMADPSELTLRALYAMFPNNDLLSLIEELDGGATY